MTFATGKARQQVERILEYLACPGLACLLDHDGSVLAAAGEVDGFAAQDVARAFSGLASGCAHGAPIRLPELGDGYVAQTRELVGARYLVALTPCDMVATSFVRVERARQLLERMLERGTDAVDELS